jgi:hypothetical protein
MLGAWRGTNNGLSVDLLSDAASYVRGCFSIPWLGNGLATHLAVSRERSRMG